MSLFTKLFKNNKVSKSYLKELINRTNKLSNYKYFLIDENNCEISYMSTKNTSFIGLQLGLTEQYKLKKYILKKMIE